MSPTATPGASPTVAVFAGTFDPLTLGHLDLIRRGAALFPRLVVCVSAEGRSTLFSAEERRAFVQEAVAGLGNVEVASFKGLLVAEATRTYQQLAKSDLGPSYGTSGLGDLALYEGRFAEAVRVLAEGAAADLEAKEPDRAAMKFAQLAHAELMRQRKPAAIAAAEKALANSQIVSVRFMAARALAEAGAPDKARQIAKAEAMA